MNGHTDLGQILLHNLRAVVHGEDDVGHAGLGESLDLVQDHALVAELNQRLGQGQGLSCMALAGGSSCHGWCISEWAWKLGAREYSNA